MEYSSVYAITQAFGGGGSREFEVFLSTSGSVAADDKTTKLIQSHLTSTTMVDVNVRRYSTWKYCYIRLRDGGYYCTTTYWEVLQCNTPSDFEINSQTGGTNRITLYFVSLFWSVIDKGCVDKWERLAYIRPLPLPLNGGKRTPLFTVLAQSL